MRHLPPLLALPAAVLVVGLLSACDSGQAPAKATAASVPAPAVASAPADERWTAAIEALQLSRGRVRVLLLDDGAKTVPLDLPVPEQGDWTALARMLTSSRVEEVELLNRDRRREVADSIEAACRDDPTPKCAAEVRREVQQNSDADMVTARAAGRCARTPNPRECEDQAAREAAYR